VREQLAHEHAHHLRLELAGGDPEAHVAQQLERPVDVRAEAADGACPLSSTWPASARA
jgi:hypothetical protein